MPKAGAGPVWHNLTVCVRERTLGVARTMRGSALCFVLASLGCALSPGQVHNLTGWQLQTCLEHPRTVEGDALAAYSDGNFYLGADGTIVMRTPDNAPAVTTHADHPRTEFRETGCKDWNFDAGEHVLTMRTAVTRVSTTNNETILAQIHGSVDEEVAKVLKLRWTGGRVEARVKNATAPNDEFGLDCGSYSLGDQLAVEVRVSAGVLSVSVNGHSVQYTPPFNPSDHFYFKAGDYNQCHPCGGAGQYAEVHLSELNTTHIIMPTFAR